MGGCAPPLRPANDDIEAVQAHIPFIVQRHQHVSVWAARSPEQVVRDQPAGEASSIAPRFWSPASITWESRASMS